MSCHLQKQEATEDKKEELSLGKHFGNFAKASFMDINFSVP
jgi:hypothetical protein